VQRGGSVLVPAFAVDRTEVVLKVLADMRRHDRIPRVPIVVNSPMALAALAVYRDLPDELRGDLDLQDLLGDVREIRTAEESRTYTLSRHESSIIISSSGMATGGRVLHHLERMLPDPRNAVVLTGYQAAGTRGRALVEGATRLKMHGQYVGVKAEILQDSEFSVHADASDLIDWLRDLHPAPATVFCVHGEPDPAAALAARIERELGLAAVVPALDEVVVLGAGGGAAAHPAAAPAPLPAAQPPSAPTTESAAPVGVRSISWGGIPIGGVHVETDLRPRQQDDRTIVLEGTITIRLDPTEPA
jgi:metallo-beta-lactamase family protein